MAEFKNDFAPMVDSNTVTTAQVIQLLKIQIVKWSELPQEVKLSVGEALSSSLKQS